MSPLPAATKSTTIGLFVVELEARVRQEKLNDLLWAYLVSPAHLTKHDLSHMAPCKNFHTSNARQHML